MTYLLLIVQAYSLNTTANESLRVTGMQFLLKVSLNHTPRSRESRKWLRTKKLLIDKQILFVSNVGNVKGTVWNIYILMLRCKGLMTSLLLRLSCSAWWFPFRLSIKIGYSKGNCNSKDKLRFKTGRYLCYQVE